jgi:hypothetical protein
MSERQSFEVELPSRGLAYPDHPILSSGKVEIFPMRAKEGKILAGMSGARGRVQDSLNLLLRKTVKGDLEPDDLLVTDWYFLLVRVRVISYGDEYTFESRCRSCNEIFEHTVNLSEDMVLTQLPEDFAEPFEIELPVSKDRVGLRLLRGSDERKITAARRQGGVASRKKTTGGGAGVLESPSYIPRIAAQVVTVNGEELHPRDKVRWVEELMVRDSNHLQKEAADRDSGYSGKVAVECSRCAFEFEMLLPWDAGFFPWG